MSTVTLLDVGHGNCAIVRDDKAVAVVDSPIGSLLLETLREMEVSVISVAVISHADKDHISGILSLLTSEEFRVEKIYVNPDGQRTTKAWKDFRVAVSVAEKKGECKVETSVSTQTPGVIKLGATEMHVVCPSAALALTGVGGKTPETNRTVTANTMSAALRIEKEVGTGVLLAGDIDDISLDDAAEHGAELRARYLVFPHHGGAPGGADIDAFTDKLLDLVRPESVVFSNGSGRHDNPRPEIVEIACGRGCKVACTELSARCGGPIPDAGQLEDVRSYGRASGCSCAGSITLDLDPGAVRIAGADDKHREFVETLVPTPMCRGKTTGTPKPVSAEEMIVEAAASGMFGETAK